MVWPLSGRELAEALGAEIHASRGDSVLTSALAGRERRGVGGDVFFAIRPDLLPLVPQMLADGAELAVVPAEWLAARIVSPEMRTRYVPVESPLRAFRQLGAFMRRRFSFPVIAVGGSNGKTTTKEMIAAVLGSSGHTVTKTPGTNNGWVGTPISLCHPAHREGTLPSALVLEIGIDEIGAMESHVRIASPDLSVLTALEKEHLEGLRSLEICVREEMKLFAVPRRFPTTVSRRYRRKTRHS